MVYPLPKVNAMAKPKLLYVITQGEKGGAQQYVTDLARGLLSEWNIAIAVGEPDGRKEAVEEWKTFCPVIQLRHLMRRVSLLHDLLAIQELRRVYETVRPDIVHVNSTKAGIIGSLAAPPIEKRPFGLVYTAHGWIFNEPTNEIKKTLYRFAETITAPKKDLMIVLSRRDAEQAAGVLHMPDERIRIIRHGILPPRLLSREEARMMLADATGCHTVHDTTTWIGVIANYYPTKGLDVLLDAISLLPEEQKQSVHCFFIGEGPEREALESRIRQHRLEDRVSLVGAVPEAAALLSAFDLCVIPSRKEGLPYVLLEAFAAGVPVIASGVGGIPDIIQDEKTGLLIQEERPEALANAIERAMTSMEEMKRMAERANTSVHRFELSRMLTETADAYRHLLRARELS